MTVVRRYYFHRTLSAAFVALDIPDRVWPLQTAPHTSREHLAWIAVHIARMSLTEPTDAPRAKIWIVKLADALVELDLWTSKRRQELIAQDFLEGNDRPVVRRLYAA